MSFIKYGRYIGPIQTQRFSYVKRRRNSIERMHNAICTDYVYLNVITKYDKLMVKKYYPVFKANVNEKYYDLISIISAYFNVTSVWVYKAYPGTNEPIKTIWMFGYKEDVMLASKYISNELNNLDTLRYIKQRIYRRRRRTSRKYKRKKINILSAKEKATQTWLRTLNLITSLWLGCLNDKPKQLFLQDKMDKVNDFVRSSIELDFGKRDFQHRPKFERAFCRKSKYQKNKVIHWYH